MKKLLIALACSLCISLHLSGQYSIAGTVKDAADGAPLYGAHIIVKNTFKGVYSGTDGGFQIRNLTPGTYELSFSFLGYETKLQQIGLTSDLALEIKLQRNAIMTDELVVQATRATANTPATYTNLNRKELLSGNLGQDLPFMISLTPSMITSSDAGAGVGYTWMNIRGSDYSRINVTINGIPVNDAESHGVWWVNMPDIVASTGNLQIQRGVGLSTHGAGAFGATVSLQTQPLKEEAFAEINSSAGSYNTFKNSVSFGSGLIRKHWAFEGRMSDITSDGYIDRASSKLSSYYLSGAWYGKNTAVKAITFSGKEKTYQAWYGVPGDSLKTNRTFNPAGMYYDSDGALQYYDNETDNYQQDHYQLHLTHAFSGSVTLNISGHYTAGEGFYEQYRANEKFSRYNLPDIILADTLISRSDLIRRRWLDNHFYGFTYSLNLKSLTRWNTTLGGGYNIYSGLHFGEIVWARYALHTGIRHRYYDNDALKKDFNTFFKTDFEIQPGLNLFADLQYRYISYNFLGLTWLKDQIANLQQNVDFHFFNPKFGLNYRLNAANRLYFYAGIGNREPVRKDFTDSSPDSRPSHETMLNIETGYQHQSRRFVFGGNIYLMHYKNQLILTGEINDVGGFTRKNIRKSYRTGIELEAAWLISTALQWNANLTLSRNIIPEFVEFVDVYDNAGNWIEFKKYQYRNTSIAFSPSVLASSQISWQPAEGLNLNLSSKYVGNQYIDNSKSKNRVLDPYWVHNLRIAYSIKPRFVNEVQITAQLNNLLNAMYVTNAWVYKGVAGDQGFTTLQDGYFPQAGRHFLAGISLKF